jgi:hypothetical protein
MRSKKGVLSSRFKCAIDRSAVKKLLAGSFKKPGSDIVSAAAEISNPRGCKILPKEKIKRSLIKTVTAIKRWTFPHLAHDETPFYLVATSDVNAKQKIVRKESRLKKWRKAFVAKLKKVFGANKANEAMSAVITESP